MTNDLVDRIAERLDTAAAEAKTVPMISIDTPIDVETGYRIQRASIARREARGDGIVGHKLGLTSRAKMEQVGVHEPIRGVLTRTMHLADDATISVAEHCHPRVEPEVAFVLDAALEPGISPADAMARVRHVHVALEVIDSRYENFKFTLADVVADNCSSSRFVMGDRTAPADAGDLSNLGVVLTLNGEVVHTASTAAVLGDPTLALADLATMLDHHPGGLRAEAGQVLLSGGATAAVHVKPGDVVEVEIERLGKARVRVAE